MGEPVKKPILYGGRFAELNREYSGEYSREYSFGAGGWERGSAQCTAQLAGSRLGLGGLNGSNMARVWLSRRLPLGAWAARGQTVQNLQAARVGYLRLR